MASQEELEEQKHFRKIVQVFKSYKKDSFLRLQKSSFNFKVLPDRHRDLLRKYGYEANLKSVKKCIEHNANMLLLIISHVEHMFHNQDESNMNGSRCEDEVAMKTSVVDMEKLQSTLKTLVRDWSAEGQPERDQCYSPILQALERIYGSDAEAVAPIKVLVPGAGLGRLAFEIARRGFECQGNEFSLFMLFVSNFVLNKSTKANCFTIYPWVHQITNNLHCQDMIRPCQFPDIDSNLAVGANFSMAAGDFLDVYSTEEFVASQDCVVTCFFMDCAHNVIDFIELIHQILKPGGKWINFGPLLYHFADIPNEPSIEPSYHVVRNVILDTGFTFDEERTDLVSTYCQNPKSMLQFHYNCVFFICTKP